MKGQEVHVPSFIMDIYKDYDSVWNRNRVRPFAVRGALPPPSPKAEKKEEEKKMEEGGMSSGPVSQPQPVKSSSLPPVEPSNQLSEE